MKDRASTYPGRVKLVPVAGQENTYDLTWADEPVQVGTPLNKATLLADTVAQKLRITLDDPTVSDAFAAGLDVYSVVTVSDRTPVVADAEKSGDFWIDKNGTECNAYISLPDGSGGVAWYALHTDKKRLKTVIFTESTIWDVPMEALGQLATVHVYGGGGGGSYGGGGGGYMATWVGYLSQAQYAVTVGAGGQTRPVGAGGTSAFGSAISALGGESGGGKSGYDGGKGGSGGGGYSAGKSTRGIGGEGELFGGGGGSIDEDAVAAPGAGKTGTPASPHYDSDRSVYVAPGGNGIDTTALGIPSVGKGTGRGGAGLGWPSFAHGGGGGGYGGDGGAGGGTPGGGGGYGAGNYGAGGDGGVSGGAGRSGIVVVMYYGW